MGHLHRASSDDLVWQDFNDSTSSFGGHLFLCGRDLSDLPPVLRLIITSTFISVPLKGHKQSPLLRLGHHMGAECDALTHTLVKEVKIHLEVLELTTSNARSLSEGSRANLMQKKR